MAATPPDSDGEEPALAPQDRDSATRSAPTVVEGTPSRSHPRTEVAPLTKGTLLGRYVVLDRIGEGGMGVVHAAYDPDLNRRVALKVMQPHAATEAGGEARMLREAQSLARLSHPNVVAVHDVGSVGDRVYLAMELVEGQTLGAWLRESKRSWREVVAAFVAAGQGLAAAHAAGVIHRDFKPGNVLVGSDGRVRVMDFGLARAGSETADEPREPLRGTSRDMLGEDLTVTGSILGTPHYMPPEAYRGETGEAGDQFSFCVALYEALYAQPPFAFELARDDDARWVVREPPRRTAVPRWIGTLVSRGLARTPDARHPSMHALVAALARDPAAGRRRVLAATSALGLVALAGISYTVTRQDTPAMCRGAGATLAVTWDAEKSRAIEQAFVRSGVPGAVETWARTAKILDGYAAAWIRMHTEACEATRVRGEQSEEVLTLRMTCLDRRRADLAGLVDMLGHAERGAVTRAVGVANALPELARCADIAALRAPIPPPEDPEVMRQADQIYRDLARARVANDHDALAKVASSAHVLGWAPLVAESELALGSTLAIVFEHKRAQQALERAVIAALAGNDDRSLAEALLEQVKYSPASQVDQARAELARAKAVIDRLGDPTLEIRALVAESRLEGTADRMPRALEVATEAIAVAEERLGGDALETAEAHEHLAGLLSWAGRPIDAEPHARKALDGKRRLLGPKHSDLIQTLSIVGDIAATGGHPEDAVSALREARAVAEAAYGPDHVQVANALMLESGVLAQGGRLDDAIATIERARAIRRVRQASTDNLVVIDQIQYGWILLQAGRNERAAEELAAGVAILDASGELESELHARTVSALFSQLATAHARVGRRRESLAALDRVLRMPEGTNPATRSRRVDVLIDAASWHLTFGDPRVAIGYVREARRVAGEVDTKDEWWEVDIAKNLGRGYLAIDRPKHALAELEPTLKAVERDDPGARERSPSVKFSLARALDGAGGDRARAGALARQAFAERELAHVDPAEYPTKREIERWLARDPATGHRSASDEH